MGKVFRDPVHNLISFGREEEKLILNLINTKEMQRLRRIRQLGLSFLTYPGGDHSRFTHSLGVAFLAKKLIDTLSYSIDTESKDYVKELQQDSKALLAAALLHDIGHGPFSHTSETLMGKNHEEWSVEIISDESTSVNKELKKANLVNKVKNIINKSDESILVKIISSQLDVDRFDYLLRDSLMAGVQYGKYDLEWILHSLRLRKVGYYPEIVVDVSKGKHAVEGYILARFWMYTQVYYHKTTRGAEVLIGKIFERANEIVKTIKSDRIVKKLLLKKKLSVLEYLSLDDITLLYHFKEWAKSSDKILKDLCGRFLDRKLFKSIDLAPYSANAVNLSKNLLVPLGEYAKDNSFNPDYYIGQDTVDNTAYKDHLFDKQPGDPEISEKIFVVDKKGGIHDFSDPEISDVINALRKRKHPVERLYFPEQLREKVTELEKNLDKKIGGKYV